MPLNRIDISILEVLQKDGRTSNDARRIQSGLNAMELRMTAWQNQWAIVTRCCKNNGLPTMSCCPPVATCLRRSD
ncbi:Lrp/AsnC family transcriptional regulator [Mesorhizobium caraganae]|uniref:Lrp/AsnC family transcriptional regulator n=1 Tax=Mesorhizobium caraganae TaxID=483206 RepID=UPI001939B788|nr:Lrp/AsnC family transcriptional regulator [Mesorhizobium caraganae]MBM2713507.1 Lrp/AsnC family transcriptional regulator [Mesorhizobium caraganae]